MENDVIYDKIQSIAHHIARNNSDFICSCCLSTLDDLYSLASYILGADAAGIIEEECTEIMEEEEE